MYCRLPDHFSNHIQHQRVRRSATRRSLDKSRFHNAISTYYELNHCETIEFDIVDVGDRRKINRLCFRVHSSGQVNTNFLIGCLVQSPWLTKLDC